MTDNEIIEALKRCPQHTECCYCNSLEECGNKRILTTSVFDLINRQKAEIEKLKQENEFCHKTITENAQRALEVTVEEIETAKSEAIKEFADKITEVFRRYAHLHTHAKGARTDYIETFDLTEIEMQSVWDVLTLKKNDMAEYEEMGRLQKNIEIIAMERLLNELEEDFRLLVKEMREENK